MVSTCLYWSLLVCTSLNWSVVVRMRGLELKALGAALLVLSVVITSHCQSDSSGRYVSMFVCVCVVCHPLNFLTLNFGPSVPLGPTYIYSIVSNLPLSPIIHDLSFEMT